MNTFHIKPESMLARTAAAQVRELVKEHGPKLMIAVRGQSGYDDGDRWEAVYSVSPCPDQNAVWKYQWEYVYAGEWIAQYDASNP